MKKIKIQFLSQYKNKNGKTVFRYKLVANEEALDAYVEAQQEGLTIRDDEGNLIYLTTRFAGKTNTLVVTENGKIYVDNSELEQMASIVDQVGGKLGEAMAQEIARKLVANQGVAMNTGSAVAKAEEEEPAEDNQPPVVNTGRRSARAGK